MTTAPLTASKALDRHEAIAFAQELADAARPIAMAHFRGTFDTSVKADGLPATTLTAASSTRIAARYPDHGRFDSPPNLMAIS
jgi:inositol-phosphate phosphatase/L-galactose 1-phosphate phosphatase/histidinol-phosphatase